MAGTLHHDAEKQKLPSGGHYLAMTTAAPPPIPVPAVSQKEHSAYRGFAAGVFSGIAKLTVGHPFDTIKVRLQTSPPERFKGPLDCLLKTVRNESIRGVYKGATPPLVGWMCMDAVMLGSLTNYRALLQKHVYNSEKLPATGHGIAGMFAGWTVSFIAAPVEHIKARLQVQYHRAGATASSSPGQTAKPRYSGPIDCSKQIIQSHGIRGLFHGLTATLIFRSSFFFWWSSHSILHAYLTNHTSLSKPSVDFWAGGLSAQVFWIFSYPSDVVKQRIMTDPLESDKRRFWNWRQAAQAVWQEQGFKGYWRGFVPCFLRAFPANAAALTAFGFVMRVLP